MTGRRASRDTRLTRALAFHCEALAVCRRCRHAPGVVPILSRAACPRVMLVGQAPGKTEIVGEKPFAGRAGRTLFKWLARCGLDEASARERIYIAAMTRCYPGPSPTGRGDRVPSPAQLEACSSWLDAELEIIRPPLVIPVGRLAISRFLPALPLDELIGRPHPIDHAGGSALAIPLPHPSGASSWIHQGDHPQLLDRAITLLGRELASLGVTDACDRSVA